MINEEQATARVEGKGKAKAKTDPPPAAKDDN
jgi:hypothetical protein